MHTPLKSNPGFVMRAQLFHRTPAEINEALDAESSRSHDLPNSNFNCSVEFSELWKNNYDRLVNYQLNEDNEEVIKGESEEIEKGNSEGIGDNGNTDADAE